MDAADDWFGADEGDFLYQVDHQLVAEGAVEFEDHYQDHLEDNDNNDSSDFDIDLEDYNGDLIGVDLDNDIVGNDIDLSDIDIDDDRNFEFRDLSLELEGEEEGHFNIDGPLSPRHPIQSPHSPQSPSSSDSSLPGFDIDLGLPYDFDHDSGLDIPGFSSSSSSGSLTDTDNEEEEDDENEDNEDTSSEESDNDSDSSVERRVREQFDIFEATARIEARLDQLEQRRQLFVQGLAEARRRFESIAGEDNRLGRAQNRHHPYRVPALLDRRRAAAQQQGGGGASGLGEGAAAPRNNNAGRLDELVEMEVGWPGGRAAGRRTPAAANNNHNHNNPAQQDNQIVIDLTSDLEDSDAEPLAAPLRLGRAIGDRRNRPSASVEARRAARARRAVSANANNNNNNGAAAGAPPANQAGNGFAEVIDLTLDDDDPAPAGPAAAAPGGHRNNRRGNIERSRRPVSRRPAANELIVDLGEVDSDDDDAIARAAHRPGPAPNFNQARIRPPAAAGRAARAGGGGGGGGGGRVGGMIDNFFQLIRMGAFAGGLRPDLEVQLIGLDANNNPLGRNLPNFNYANNGRNGAAAAAAAAAAVAAAEQARNANAPPPAREGFTRATGEDLAIVCPSCEQELAYDPDEEERNQKAAAGGGGPAPKKARTRKDREEHFFWAVKECGHVYCKKCFENRKCTKNTGFKLKDQGSSGAAGTSASGRAAAKTQLILCAVDDCSAEVGVKTAWVGLFL
ncbi:hypothetical protein QBC32DRAFT_82303 [Pseudoneurospora amorphoporcata]|uniref:Cell cycle control protein n=1 Tax=Pseudoneurospora amorphoporcata TaxID=241081 RepID=A0AAN6P2Q2_9PEZI|nr:hypothetical protein QBC32DRAFT_82303 [Pseudoneurospora amorphoporcata]